MVHLLRRQREVRDRQHRLLRRRPARLAAAALLVAGGRGAVLPRVAAAAARRPGAAATPGARRCPTCGARAPARPGAGGARRRRGRLPRVVAVRDADQPAQRLLLQPRPRVGARPRCAGRGRAALDLPRAAGGAGRRLVGGPGDGRGGGAALHARHGVPRLRGRAAGRRCGAADRGRRRIVDHRVGTPADALGGAAARRRRLVVLALPVALAADHRRGVPLRRGVGLARRAGPRRRHRALGAHLPLRRDPVPHRGPAHATHPRPHPVAAALPGDGAARRPVGGRGQPGGARGPRRRGRADLDRELRAARRRRPGAVQRGPLPRAGAGLGAGRAQRPGGAGRTRPRPARAEGEHPAAGRLRVLRRPDRGAAAVPARRRRRRQDDDPDR